MSIVTNTALRRVLTKVAASEASLRKALTDRMQHLRGRNLLRGTSDEWFESTDSTLKIPLADAPAAGETVTLS